MITETINENTLFLKSRLNVISFAVMLVIIKHHNWETLPAQYRYLTLNATIKKTSLWYTCPVFTAKATVNLTMRFFAFMNHSAAMFNKIFQLRIICSTIIYAVYKTKYIERNAMSHPNFTACFFRIVRQNNILVALNWQSLHRVSILFIARWMQCVTHNRDCKRYLHQPFHFVKYPCREARENDDEEPGNVEKYGIHGGAVCMECARFIKQNGAGRPRVGAASCNIPKLQNAIYVSSLRCLRWPGHLHLVKSSTL